MNGMDISPESYKTHQIAKAWEIAHDIRETLI